MAKTIKMRARSDGDGVVVVKALITHPMETGRRQDRDSGETVPAHFIQKVVGEYRGEKVFEAYWGTGVSKNPYIAFRFDGGEKGGKIKLSWVDNLGQSDSLEETIQ